MENRMGIAKTILIKLRIKKDKRPEKIAEVVKLTLFEDQLKKVFVSMVKDVANCISKRYPSSIDVPNLFSKIEKIYINRATREYMEDLIQTFSEEELDVIIKFLGHEFSDRVYKVTQENRDDLLMKHSNQAYQDITDAIACVETEAGAPTSSDKVANALLEDKARDPSLISLIQNLVFSPEGPKVKRIGSLGEMMGEIVGAIKGQPCDCDVCRETKGVHDKKELPFVGTD